MVVRSAPAVVAIDATLATVGAAAVDAFTASVVMFVDRVVGMESPQPFPLAAPSAHAGNLSNPK